MNCADMRARKKHLRPISLKPLTPRKPVKMGVRGKGRVAAPAAQPLVGIGHNGAPDDEALSLYLAMRLFEVIGPRADLEIEPFECGAPWTAHATEEGLKRLGTLQARIIRREQALKELKAERKRIMNRNIRRMRRADGKE